MQSDSLWPDDLFKKKLVAPSLILKEQAKYLGELSGRSILGNVDNTRISPTGYGGYSSDDEETADVAHVFQLQVPGLGDYTFDLFQVRHHPRSLYPVFIYFNLAEEGREIQCDSEEEFRDAIKNILTAPETVAVIRTLRAQTEDPETLPPRFTKKEQAEAPSEESTEDDDIPF